MTGPGGSEIRARAKRHQRLPAAVALAAVVLTLIGAGALLLRPSTGHDRITPADGSWKQAVRDARIDLRTKADGNCSGSLLQFRDGKARGGDRAGNDTIY